VRGPEQPELAGCVVWLVITALAVVGAITIMKEMFA
jgi:hypothetical protein